MNSFATVIRLRASRHSIRRRRSVRLDSGCSGMRTCDVMFQTPHDALYFSWWELIGLAAVLERNRGH